MSIPSQLESCPKCGGPIPADAPQGLCPKCLLLQASIPTEAGKGASSKSAPPTHEELVAFFSRLLARQGIDNVDPQRGRFRSFLLGAAKHFLADMRDHAQRLKRGAGQPIETIDPGTDTSPGLQLPDPNAPSPERLFDRGWALTLLDRALAVIAEEHKAAGKSDQFEALKPWLTGDTENISQAEAARQLDLNEGAVKVAIHRLRRRFREVIKNEIGQTVNDRAQVEEELHYLLEALL